MSLNHRMILCLVCLAAMGMLFVAGCTTQAPSGNATKAPAASPAPTMNNTILKINNNQAPNLSTSATTAATTVTAPPAAANVTIPVNNSSVPAVPGINVTVPATNMTVPGINVTVPAANVTATK
ncbi:MAG TPA: hypothetical protein PK089_02790 [Methanoregulaceae archaeon]|nr:hypothetical protein [Methanoregulaceae archaeon]HOV67021.1 hypothetical protein [Methanoregulaceae archaeon]